MASLSTKFRLLGTKTLQKGTVLFRVHSDSFKGDQFNNTARGHARFSPLLWPGTKTVISSIYAGSTLQCALMEIVFRNQSIKRDAQQQILMSDLKTKAFTSLTISRDIVLADLSTVGLSAMGIKRKDLIDTPETQYNNIRKWAARLLNARPDIHGFRWVSRQDDEAIAYVFFDRGSNLSFFTDVETTSATDALNLKTVVQLSRKVGAVIVEEDVGSTDGKF